MFNPPLNCTPGRHDKRCPYSRRVRSNPLEDEDGWVDVEKAIPSCEWEGEIMLGDGTIVAAKKPKDSGSWKTWQFSKSRPMNESSYLKLYDDNVQSWRNF